MAAIARFVLLAAAVLAATQAAPAEKSSPSKILRSVTDLIAVVEEYQPRFEELSLEKDQMLAFARTALFATFRHMNEEMLINFGNTRNAIEYGFDETRAEIADDILSGGDEDCLLNLVSLIIDEQRELASRMSECANTSNQDKDELAYSFYEVLELLQRMSTSLTEHLLWTFSNYNSFVSPAEHADFIQRSFEESVDLWNNEVQAVIQFEIDAMEYNRPILVAENLECLNRVAEQVQPFDEEIRSRISTCVAPLKK
ncbi:uncharacterized protein LOC129723897 [Wyeomyia smithii]|uniref:uncharacterized protein LOC129723897 n=1 Tax=Wyeomyia smithii TaxID=174621 RepID=UPI002467C4CB|nr:uncharacterized protein LOC129723897 [Wyeomyia smithii]